MDIARSIKGLKLRTLFFQGLKVLLPALLTVIHTAILSLIFIELLLVISKSSRPGPLFPQKCLIHPERLKNYQLLVPIGSQISLFEKFSTILIISLTLVPASVLLAYLEPVFVTTGHSLFARLLAPVVFQCCKESKYCETPYRCFILRY